MFWNGALCLSFLKISEDKIQHHHVGFINAFVGYFDIYLSGFLINEVAIPTIFRPNLSAIMGLDRWCVVHSLSASGDSGTEVLEQTFVIILIDRYLNIGRVVSKRCRNQIRRIRDGHRCRFGEDVVEQRYSAPKYAETKDYAENNGCILLLYYGITILKIAPATRRIIVPDRRWFGFLTIILRYE